MIETVLRELLARALQVEADVLGPGGERELPAVRLGVGDQVVEAESDGHSPTVSSASVGSMCSSTSPEER